MGILTNGKPYIKGKVSEGWDMSRLRRFFLVFVCFGYLIVDYFLCIAEQLYEQVTQILFSVRLFC